MDSEMQTYNPSKDQSQNMTVDLSGPASGRKSSNKDIGEASTYDAASFKKRNETLGTVDLSGDVQEKLVEEAKSGEIKILENKKKGDFFPISIKPKDIEHSLITIEDSRFSDVDQVKIFNEHYVINTPEGYLAMPIGSMDGAKLIGQGGFGSVYEGVNPDGSLFVLKHVDVQAKGSDYATRTRKDTLREAELMQKFKDVPYIASLEGIGGTASISGVSTPLENSRAIFLKMEHAGETLSNFDSYSLEGEAIVSLEKNIDEEKKEKLKELQETRDRLLENKKEREKLEKKKKESSLNKREEILLSNFINKITLESKKAKELRAEIDKELMEVQKELVVDKLRRLKSAFAGMHIAHERGYVHKDIKPANMTLDSDDGEPGKLIDLGIMEQEGVAVDRIKGTPAYYDPTLLLNFKGRKFKKNVSRFNDYYAGLLSAFNFASEGMGAKGVYPDGLVFRKEAKSYNTNPEKRRNYHNNLIKSEVNSRVKDKDGNNIFNESFFRGLQIGNSEVSLDNVLDESQLYLERLDPARKEQIYQYADWADEGNISEDTFTAAYDNICKEWFDETFDQLIESVESLQHENIVQLREANQAIYDKRIKENIDLKNDLEPIL